jgi:general L-amino acid transport system permease protein
MAEPVRGGLQALPESQTEAAQALGPRLLAHPAHDRAAAGLAHRLPAMTNEFISLFKSTTLVLIVSIFDCWASPRQRSPTRPGSA